LKLAHKAMGIFRTAREIGNHSKMPISAQQPNY
jgi:hypothetical protein